MTNEELNNRIQENELNGKRLAVWSISILAL